MEIFSCLPDLVVFNICKYLTNKEIEDLKNEDVRILEAYNKLVLPIKKLSTRDILQQKDTNPRVMEEYLILSRKGVVDSQKLWAAFMVNEKNQSLKIDNVIKRLVPLTNKFKPRHVTQLKFSNRPQKRYNHFTYCKFLPCKI
jgi:hypothetical protein